MKKEHDPMRAAYPDSHEKPAQPKFPASTMADDDSESGLLDIWGLVRRRYLLIVFGVALCLGLATLYYFSATPIFESKGEILVMRKDANLPTKASEGNGGDADSIKENLLSTHVQLLQSPRVIQGAIKRRKLDQLPSLRKVAENSEHFNPVEYIQKQLKVKKGGEKEAKDAWVLQATFRNPSPQDCKEVLAAIVESYQDFVAETIQKGKSTDALNLIKQAKDEIQNDLNTAEKAYQKFRQTAPMFWAIEGNISGPHFEALKQVELNLLDLRVRRAGARTRLEVINETLRGKTPKDISELDQLSLIGSDDVPRLSLLLSAARPEAASASFLSSQPLRAEAARTEYDKQLTVMLDQTKALADFGPDHPDAKKARLQIEQIQKYLKSKPIAAVDEKKEFTPADLLKASMGSLQHDLHDSEKREKFILELETKEKNAAPRGSGSRGTRRNDARGLGPQAEVLRHACRAIGRDPSDQRLRRLYHRGHHPD